MNVLSWYFKLLFNSSKLKLGYSIMLKTFVLENY